MNIMQIVSVKLKDGVEHKLTKAAYDRAHNWLSHWTCVANFQAVITESCEASLIECQRMLQERLVPSWLEHESGIKPHHFTFEVSEQTVKNGRFWMSTQVVWCKRHIIPEEPV